MSKTNKYAMALSALGSASFLVGCAPKTAEATEVPGAQQTHGAEGSCGGSKAGAEGSCGGSKARAEGSCGGSEASEPEAKAQAETKAPAPVAKANPPADKKKAKKSKTKGGAEAACGEGTCG